MTGGCGYIGSHVTRLLSEAGHNVVVYDNLSTGSRDALLNNEILIGADLADEARLTSVLVEHKIETVFHFAASIVVSDSINEPLTYYENNTVNTIKLLRSSNKAQVKKLIFSSTAAVYGDAGSSYVSEETLAKPVSPYGRSKLMDEWILDDMAKAHGLKYAILRYFNVAGAGHRNLLGQRTRTATHLIKVACETALGRRGFMTINGSDYSTPDGTCIRDFIHVEDLAEAHLLCMNHLNSKSENLLVNCGYETGYSVLEVIDSVKRVSGVDFDVKVGPRRSGDMPSLIARSKVLKEHLGWVPKFNSLDLIVKTALAWEEKFIK